MCYIMKNITFWYLSGSRAAVPNTECFLNWRLISGSVYVVHGYLIVSNHCAFENFAASADIANYKKVNNNAYKTVKNNAYMKKVQSNRFIIIGIGWQHNTSLNWIYGEHFQGIFPHCQPMTNWVLFELLVGVDLLPFTGF